MSYKNIIRLDRVNSTNNYLSSLVKNEKPEHGTIVIAENQMSGRGIGENEWESESGKNLTFSILFHPRFLAPAKQFILSEAIALGIFDYLNSQFDDVKIKWPNDIYVGDKKIAGILIENSLKGDEIQYSIAGIGININQTNFVSKAPNPVSLKQLTNLDYELEEEFIKLLDRIFHQFDHVTMSLYHNINENYLKNMYWLNEWKPFRSNGEEFEGMIVGISEFGHLKVQLKNDDIKEFDLKEVEFLNT